MSILRLAAAVAWSWFLVSAAALAVDAPTFSPPAGSYPVSQLVTLSAEPDATIRYTTDGSEPTADSGTVYTGPVAVTSSTTIKAIATRPGEGGSAVNPAIYQIDSNRIAADGGFEVTFVPRGLDALPGAWKRFPIDGITRSTITASPGIVRSGNGAQQIRVTRLMNGNPRLSIPIPGGISAGRDYEAAVWLKSAKRDARATLCVHNANDWFPSSFSSLTCGVGQDWTPVVLRFRATQTAATALLGIHLAEENTLWVDDASFRELAPADRGPASPAGNLVRHASFETGTAGWKASGVSFVPEPDATAPHGARSAKISWFGGTSNVLQSHGMELPWGRTHTLSMYARTPVAGRAITVSVQSGSATLATTTYTTASTAWERVVLTFNPPPVPDGTCFIVIDPPDQGNISIDAVMLETGDTPSAFSPFAPVESALVIHYPGRQNAYFAPVESVTGTLSLFNSGTQEVEIPLRRRVMDVWDQPVPGSVHTWSQTLPPGRTDLPLVLKEADLRTGAFRAECDVADDLTPPYAEALFSVFPPLAPGVAAPLGTTLDYNIGGPPGYRAAGVAWTKTWLLDWNTAQPTSSSPFAFTPSQDERINAWTAAGLKPLGILGHAPGWAQQFTSSFGWSNPVDFQQQSAYAAAALQRYGPQVPVWELQNEPNQDVQASPGDTRATAYAKEAIALANGAWSVDPQAKLLLGSLTIRDEFRSFFNEIFKAQPALKALDPATGKPRLHGVSFHFYTADPALIRRTARDIRGALADQGLQGLEIWDTEWSPIDDSRSMKRAEFRGITRHSPSPRRAAALVTQGFVSRFGEGVANGILYDTYNPGNMGSTGHKVMLELDGSFRPTAAAQAALSATLTGAVRHEASDVPAAWCYRSKRADGTPVTILWSDDYQAADATVPYRTPEAVTARDFMGNPAGTHAAGSIVQVGPDPVFLFGNLGALSGLTATADDQRVSLVWDPWPGAASYTLAHGPNGLDFPNVTTGLTATSSTLSAIANGTTRYFLVTAVDGNGAPLAHSVQVSATPGAPRGVLREYWTGIPGTDLPGLTTHAAYPASPTGSDVLPSFRATHWGGTALSNWADHYGQRLRAWIVAPETGNYTFWIAGDDSTELWLSPDAGSGNRVKIAFNTTYSNQDEWNKSPTQKSSNNNFTFGGGSPGIIELTAGNRYYIEALQKENTGGDHLSVAWRKPSDGPGSVPAEIVSTVAPWTPPPPALPAAPTGMLATPGDGMVSLRWDPVEGATGYVIKRSTSSGQFYLTLATLPPDATSFTDTGLPRGATRHYVVSALAATGESPDSEERTATTFTAIEAWRFGHWNSPDPVGDAADLADPDHDRLPNLVEYAIGSDPTTDDGARVFATFDDGRLILSFRRIADPSLTYTVEGAPDLSAWAAVWTSAGLQNQPGPVTVADSETTLTQARRMLRLKIARD